MFFTASEQLPTSLDAILENSNENCLAEFMTHTATPLSSN
jgi:hypothetical protein